MDVMAFDTKQKTRKVRTLRVFCYLNSSCLRLLDEG